MIKLPPAVVTSTEAAYERRMFLIELGQFREQYLSQMLGPNWERHPDLDLIFYAMFPRTHRLLNGVVDDYPKAAS